MNSPVKDRETWSGIDALTPKSAAWELNDNKKTNFQPMLIVRR